MRIGVLRETAAGERRVALVPATVKKLVQQHQVVVQSGAGDAAFFPDESFREAGATVTSGVAEVVQNADLVVKVQPPTADQIALLSPKTIIISLLAPHASAALLGQLEKAGISALSLELVPRTTKAQSMDVLSSQATVAGYQAVLLGAHRLSRFMPMLTTAAGTITPAKAFIIGAGVAGLQAIATARRLGALVSAFDVRPVVKEQVQSLGASFVEAGEAAEGTGGYAKELSESQQQRVHDAIAKHVRDMDLIISTAAIPGRPAPRLVDRAMVESMRAGSVIVDVAAETGGNCELTQPGREVAHGGVTVIGPLNLASSLPNHASFMFSRNLLAIIEHAVKDGAFNLNLDDPILGPMCVTHAGAIRFGRAGS